jgi:hypothetical protein
MAQRILPTLLAVLLLLVGGAPLPVKAENAMGYRLLSAQEATALPTITAPSVWTLSGHRRSPTVV